jgi:hypothetical protein
MSSEFGVQSAPFHQCIHVGRVNKARTEFLEKVDGTDMVLFAVARYVLDNFAHGDGSAGMQTTFDKAGLRLRVQVEPTEPDQVVITYDLPPLNKTRGPAPEVGERWRT